MKTSLNPGGAAELALLSPSRFSGEGHHTGNKTHAFTHAPFTHA